MTESFHFEITPENEDSPEERLALRSREDWLAEVQRLEAVRESIEKGVPNPDALAYDRDFNFLLGQISVAQRELIAHTTDEVIKKIEEIQ